MNSPRLLSDSIPRIAGEVFARKYIMLGRLVTRWTEIVGADIAGRVQPVKIRRTKDRDGNPVAVLDIAAPPAEATLLHYRRDLMLERINYIFGERLVGAIRFVPLAANNAPPVRARRKPLSDMDIRNVETAVAEVTDDAVREKLAGLGAAILQDAKAGI